MKKRECELVVYEREDLSFKNILNGLAISDMLNDEINTLDLTVRCNYVTPFAPMTKFELRIYEDNELIKTTYWVLRNDIMQRINMKDYIFEHHLSLGDPAIIFQKRNCENFSMTYRLQDVTLESDIVSEELTTRIAPSRKSPTFNTQERNSMLTRYGNSVSSRPDGFFTVFDLDFQRQRYIEYGVGNTLTYYNDKVREVSDSTITSMNRLLIWDDGTPTDAQISQAVQNHYQFAKTQARQGISGYNIAPLISNAGGQPVLTIKVPIFKVRPSDNSMNYVLSGGEEYFLDTLVTIKSTNLTTGVMNTETRVARFPKARLLRDSEYNETHFFDYDNKRAIRDDSLIYTSDSYYIGRNYMGWDDEGQDNPLQNTDNPNLWQQGVPMDYTHSPYYENRYFSLGITELPVEIKRYRACFPIDYASYNCGYELENINSIQDLNNYLVANNCTIEIPVRANYNYEFIFNPIWYDAKGNQTAQKFKLVERVSGSYRRTWIGIDNNYLDYKYLEADKNDFEVSYKFSVVTLDGTIEKFFTSSLPLDVSNLFEKLKVVSNSPDLIASNDVYQVMRQTQLVESIYENKNAWEVLLEIGKYCHAKPYITFSQWELQLNFKYYGQMKNEFNSNFDDKRKVNNIYGSRSIEEYISAMDTYTQNLFQYGNTITEYLKCVDNDGTNVVVTDNAVLKTKYPILEVVKLEVCEKNHSDWHDITSRILEFNVYKTLPVTSESWNIVKGKCIYYRLNSNEILGFQYKEPSANNDKLYAIKEVIKYAYPTKTGSQLCANNFYFRITYRTKDNLRLIHTRPDIRKYIGTHYNYPQQYAFNNQVSKYLDAKKVGENIYGKLIRTGNTELTQDIYISGSINNMVHAGDFTFIDSQLYFASAVITNLFNNSITQNVTWSQDYNKLSSIVAINSEPRFYEISEQSNVLREIADMNLFTIGVESDFEPYEEEFVGHNKTQLGELTEYFMERLMFNNDRPNYAKVRCYNTSANDEALNKSFLLPVNCVSSGTTFVASVQFEDNYSAGDSQSSLQMTQTMQNATWLSPLLNIVNKASVQTDGIEDDFYKAKAPVRYCDSKGKLDCVEISFMDVSSISASDTTVGGVTYNPIDYLPLYPSETSITYEPILVNEHSQGISYRAPIYKDSRETLKFNVTYCMTTASDRIILSSSMFDLKIKEDGSEANIRVALLGEELDKYSKDLIVQKELIGLSEIVGAFSNWLTFDEIRYENDQNFFHDNFSKIKSIVWVYDYNVIEFNGKKYISSKFVVARNVAGLEYDDANQMFTIKEGGILSYSGDDFKTHNFHEDDD